MSDQEFVWEDAVWPAEPKASTWGRAVSEDGALCLERLIEQGCEPEPLVALLTHFRVVSAIRQARVRPRAEARLRTATRALNRAIDSIGAPVLELYPEIRAMRQAARAALPVIDEMAHLAEPRGLLDRLRLGVTAYVRGRTGSYCDNDLGEVLAELEWRRTRPATREWAVFRARAVERQKKFRQRAKWRGLDRKMAEHIERRQRVLAISALRELAGMRPKLIEK